MLESRLVAFFRAEYVVSPVSIMVDEGGISGLFFAPGNRECWNRVTPARARLRSPERLDQSV
jgi:hypothetical protein